MRRLAFALGLLLVCAASPSLARVFTVDDLLMLEDFGAVAFDPTGRRVVIERRGPYENAASFDHQHSNPLGASRLLLAEVDGRTGARPLTPQPSGCGYVAGPWSPDGRRLAVYRLCGRAWELGVASVSSGRVRWLGLTPASAKIARSVQWASAERLLVIARPADDPPWELRTGWQWAALVPPRWAAAAAGRAAFTLVGSGAHRQASPRPAPSRLVEIDAAGGGQEILAVGDFVDLELSPRGDQVALLEMGERLQPDARRKPQGAWGVATEARHLAVLDLATGEIRRPCPACDILQAPLSWSPSGQRLLVYSRTAGARWTDGRFQVFLPHTGAMEPLDALQVAPAFRFRPEAVETGWLGEAPLVRGRAAGGGRIDWWRLSREGAQNLTAALPAAPDAAFVGPDGLFAVADRGLWKIAPDGAARRMDVGEVGAVPPPGPQRSRRGFVASEAAAALLRGGDGRLRLGNGRALGLVAPASETIIAFDARSRSLITRRSAPQGQARLDLHRPAAAPRPLTSINLRLADADPPQVLPIRHAGPGGEALTSWLYLPPERAKAPPPLVVRPYLGDNPRTAPVMRPPILGFIADVRTLVGRGYAVLIPSLPLPMTAREPLAGLAERVVGVVDAAAAQAPGAFDPSRLAIWGHSYGGYTTLGVIGQTDRFKAAIAMNAPTDLISLYGTFPPSARASPQDGVWPSWTAGFAENAQGRMGAPPWSAPERYVRNSPLFLAGSIKTPVLLVHSDLDPISLGQAEEMFSALHRQNKDAVLVTYWGEGHVISSPGNVRDLYARAFTWLDDHLGGQSTGARPEP